MTSMLKNQPTKKKKNSVSATVLPEMTVTNSQVILTFITVA